MTNIFSDQNSLYTGGAAAGQTGASGAAPGAIMGAGGLIASKLVPAWLLKVALSPDDPIDVITFQINPNEYSISKSARYIHHHQPFSHVQGQVAYMGPEPASLSVTALFDEAGIISSLTNLATGGSVTSRVEKIQSWTEPVFTGGLTPPNPPTVRFGWGPTEPFEGYIQSVQVSYKLFRLGRPARAEVQISMNEMVNPYVPTNPSSGGRSARRTHTVVAGDSLASIAHRAYGKPTVWRAIAEANNIDDPTRLTEGRELLLPDRREVEELA
jgi:nucleoid-associated protein YgaU